MKNSGRYSGGVDSKEPFVMEQFLIFLFLKLIWVGSQKTHNTLIA